MSWRIVAVVSFFAGSFALAEDAAQRRAREEVERELKQLVGSAPMRVRVDFISPDEPNYRLEEATFEIDGQPVSQQSRVALTAPGAHQVFSGEVAAGKHKVSARLVFFNGASIVLSDEGGYKWKLEGDVTFDVSPGIEVQVKIAPSRDPNQKDVSKRFTLRMPAAPVMVAKLDDGTMPEPLAKTDAVAKVVHEKPAAEPAHPKPDRTLDGPTVAKRPAASDVVSPVTNEPKDELAPLAATQTNDAKAPEAAVVEPPALVDAGALPLVLTAPEPEGPDGALWLLGGGAVIVVILIIAVARRRSRVPTLRK